MTTPKELYERKPESVSNDLDHLAGFYYNHVAEIEDFYSHSHTIATTRVEVRFLKDWSFDGRRVWQLATVWFDDGPVMIIQNAGREGDDHAERFITDVDRFTSMCSYLKSLIPICADAPERVGFTEEITGLTEFYGNELDGSFERY